jgi:uncharacterized membrane protein YhiD involved in acid resistance
MIKEYSNYLKNTGLYVGASIILAILLVALLTFPSKKNRLEFIEEEIEKVQTQQKILTDKEKELEKLATEKDWEEVDKDTNK